MTVEAERWPGEFRAQRELQRLGIVARGRIAFRLTWGWSREQAEAWVRWRAIARAEG